MPIFYPQHTSETFVLRINVDILANSNIIQMLARKKITATIAVSQVTKMTILQNFHKWLIDVL